MAFRPYVSSGIAFVSAVAIVGATPLVIPAHDGDVRAAVAVPKTRDFTIDYRLQAVTLQGISDAFFAGYGGFTDPPTGVFVSGAPGVVYYLGDETLFAGTDLDNIFFEQGAPAVAQAVASALVGSNPLGQLVVNLVFDPLGTVTGLIVSASALFGPFVEGVTTAFFEGYDSGNPLFGSVDPGIVAVVAYVIDQGLGALPFAATKTATLNTADTESGDTTTSLKKRTDPGVVNSLKLDANSLVDVTVDPQADQAGGDAVGADDTELTKKSSNEVEAPDTKGPKTEKPKEEPAAEQTGADTVKPDDQTGASGKTDEQTGGSGKADDATDKIKGGNKVEVDPLLLENKGGGKSLEQTLRGLADAFGGGGANNGDDSGDTGGAGGSGADSK